MEFVKDYQTAREKLRRYTAEAAELKKRPGEWGVLVTDAPNRWMAKNITSGALADFTPRGYFQGSARANGDGTFTIFARYRVEPLVREERARRAGKLADAQASDMPATSSPELRDAVDLTTDLKYSKDSKLVKAVRKEQGGWAIISRDNLTTLLARDITKGRFTPFPTGQYEARAVRDPETNLFTIYARYTGEPDA